MKIKSIILEGDSGWTAEISLETLPEEKLTDEFYIKCEVRDDDGEMANIHYIQRDDRDDQLSMAECLQHQLDGCRGTNSIINAYFREIQRFAI